MTDSFLRTNGGASIDRRYARAAPVVTALPTISSSDGDIVQFKALATATGASVDARWMLVYDAASGYWYPIGAVPLVKEIDTAQSTTSSTYADLATVGPSIAAPLLGDYLITFGAETVNNTASSTSLMSIDAGGGAVDADSIALASAGATASISRPRLKTAVTFGFGITAKYKASGGVGTSFFANRFLNVLPLRVH